MNLALTWLLRQDESVSEWYCNIRRQKKISRLLRRRVCPIINLTRSHIAAKVLRS